MTLSYLCLASYLLWSSASLGADRFAGWTPKHQAQRALLHLYGMVAVAGDAAGDAAGVPARNMAGDAARYASRHASESATGYSHSVTVWATAWVVAWKHAWDAAAVAQARAVRRGPEAQRLAVVMAAWQAVLRHKEVLREAIDSRLAHETFLDPAAVNWASILTDLQGVYTKPEFQRALPEIQGFFKLEVLRISSLIADDAAQSQSLRVQVCSQIPDLSLSVARRRSVLLEYMPRVIADRVLEYDHDIDPTFQDVLNMLESTLSLRQRGKELPEGKQREGRGAHKSCSGVIL